MRLLRFHIPFFKLDDWNSLGNVEIVIASFWNNFLQQVVQFTVSAWYLKDFFRTTESLQGRT